MIHLYLVLNDNGRPTYRRWLPPKAFFPLLLLQKDTPKTSRPAMRIRPSLTKPVVVQKKGTSSHSSAHPKRHRRRVLSFSSLSQNKTTDNPKTIRNHDVSICRQSIDAAQCSNDNACHVVYRQGLGRQEYASNLSRFYR